MDACTIPQEWLHEPREVLIHGSDQFARALPQFLPRSGVLDTAMLTRGINLPAAIGLAGRPTVLNAVMSVILFWDEGVSLPELLQLHAGIWDLVNYWSKRQECHELRWIIGLSIPIHDETRASLARQLAVPSMDGSMTHTLWDRAAGLPRLLEIIRTAPRIDHQSWQGRQRAEGGWRALGGLRAALGGGNPALVQSAARAVWNLFKDRAYELDCYCRPPAHPNGHLWRDWLRAGVTQPVTPTWQEDGRALLDRLIL